MARLDRVYRHRRRKRDGVSRKETFALIATGAAALGQTEAR